MPVYAPAVSYEPHAYQRSAIRFLLERGAAALFADPGLGKTSITLAALLILKKRKMLGRVLIVAPLRVCYSVWPAELKKWRDFKDLTYELLHGPKKDAALEREADLYLINPEGLEWLLKPIKTRRGKKTSVKVDVRAFKALGFDTLVIDELTKFKNHQAIRWKMMRQVLNYFFRRWGLTGSPAANGLMGLFGQVYMLDGGASLGAYVTHYRERYFTPGWNGFTWDLQEGAEQRIYDALSNVALRIDAADHLDLPDLVENEIMVDLPEEARAIYDELERDLLVELNQGSVSAKNTGVALGKCRQVASGAIYAERDLGELLKKKRDRKIDWLLIHDAKLDALEELVETLQGKPLLVAYEFRHDLERIRERLGADLPYLGDGVSAREGDRLAQAWNRGELPILLAHPASAAHGLNLQESGQHVAWFTLTWNYEYYDQLIRRLLRQGSKHKRVFSHLFLARGTVDELVAASIRSKRTGQNALFKGLRDLQHRRRLAPTKKIK